MQTQTFVQSPAAAYPGLANLRSLDPLSVEIMARRARQEAILRALAAIGRALAAIGRAISRAVAGFFRRRALYRELATMPDHLLNDIGLRRDQVEAVAFGGLKREPSDLELAMAADSIRFFDAKPAAPATASAGIAKTGAPLAA